MVARFRGGWFSCLNGNDDVCDELNDEMRFDETTRSMSGMQLLRNSGSRLPQNVGISYKVHVLMTSLCHHGNFILTRCSSYYFSQVYCHSQRSMVIAKRLGVVAEESLASLCECQ